MIASVNITWFWIAAPIALVALWIELGRTYKKGRKK